jgi:hypothetical protein
MKGRQIKYSWEELEFIKTRRTLVRKELHEAFCNKFKRLDISLINLNALCKRKGWLTGRTGCFKKGNTPHPDAHPKGPNKTSFKSGRMPHNWKPVGSERISKDGYVEVKTKEPRTWKLKHRVVWERERGSVKKGHIIILLDGDKTNCDIKNLYEISRAVNSQLNKHGYGSLTGELRISAVAMKKLELKYRQCLRE